MLTEHVAFVLIYRGGRHLGYDYRQNPPVHVNGVGPVLDVEDIVTGKVRAFWTRGAERDFYDIDGILASDKWTIQNLYDKIAGLRPDEILLRGAVKEEFRCQAFLGAPTRPRRVCCSRDQLA